MIELLADRARIALTHYVSNSANVTDHPSSLLRGVCLGLLVVKVVCCIVKTGLVAMVSCRTCRVIGCCCPSIDPRHTCTASHLGSCLDSCLSTGWCSLPVLDTGFELVLIFQL